MYRVTITDMRQKTNKSHRGERFKVCVRGPGGVCSMVSFETQHEALAVKARYEKMNAIQAKRRKRKRK